MHLLGVSEVQAAFDRVMHQVDAASKDMVAEGAALVERTAKGNFQGAHKKGQPHVGGDKPNIVTGTLRRSIRHQPIRQDGRAEFATTIGPTVIYGRRVELEYGYAFFEPAVRDTREELKAIAAKHWKRALTKH